MNMRKILTGVLAAAMLSANVVALAEEEVMLISANPAEKDIMLISENPAEEEVVAVYDKAILAGTVKLDEELYIIDENEQEIVINTDENTLFVTKEGFKTSREELKDGDKVTVVAASAMTMSLPPQVYGYVVMVGEELPIYVEVSSIETDEDENTVLFSKDGNYKVVIGEETEFAPFATRNIVGLADIKEGSRILVYSNLMTMSIPAMMPAQKVVILPDEAMVSEETEPETIVLNGETLDAEIKNIDGAYLLPVRKVSETAGLAVAWDDTLKAVTVGTTPMGVTFNVGENSYTKAKMMPMTLSSAPIIIDDLTYVPVDFFTELLGAAVETKDGAIVITLEVNLD